MRWGDELYDPHEQNEALIELNLIDHIIFDRLHFGRFGKHVGKPVKVFLSHSSKDKPFIRRVYDDLKYLGHDPWMDEVEIGVGESLVESISKGAEEADVMVLFVSENSADSEWVRLEWEMKITEEIEKRNTKIIAARTDDTDVPRILKRKKYADFRAGYFEGLEDLLNGIGHDRDRSKLRKLPWK